MRGHRFAPGLRLGALALVVSAFGATSHAQDFPSPQPPSPETQPRVYRTTGSRVAIGRSIQVARDEEVSDAVVVIGGSLRVDGRVRDGLVVVGGDIDLGPEADISGDIVVVGGRVNRDASARIHGSISDVTFGEWLPWSMGGWWVPAVNFGNFGGWLTLFGALFRVSFLAVIMALMLILARAPVARIGHAAATVPVQAFFTGLAAEILFIPALIIACIALIVTIIGIPLAIILVPLAILTAFVAFALGFTALATRLGEWLEDRLGWRGHSAFLAAALGLFVILGPTLLSRFLGVGPWPVRVGAFSLLLVGVAIEFVVWTMGLGATLMTGFGRWSTSPPPVPPPPAIPVVA